MDRSNGPGKIRSLAQLPGTPELFGLVLQVAAGHVQADRIAEDMVEGLLDGNVPSALGQRHHQFDLEVVIAGLGSFPRPFKQGNGGSKGPAAP